jgi:hypothetical protein
VVHQLDEVAVASEDVAEIGRRLARLLVPPEPHQRLHLAGGAAGRRHDPVGVLLEQLAVHPRLVELTLDRGQRRQPEQVVHARGRLGEHRDVGVCAAARHVVDAAVAPLHAASLRPVRSRRQIGLDADDRPDSTGFRRRVELVRPEHVAVIGDRDCRHLHPRRLVEQLRDPRRPVEHRELGVDVQVHERVARGVRHRAYRSSPPSATATSRRDEPAACSALRLEGSRPWGKSLSLRDRAWHPPPTLGARCVVRCGWVGGTVAAWWVALARGGWGVAATVECWAGPSRVKGPLCRLRRP